MTASGRIPVWTWAIPLAGIAFFGITNWLGIGGIGSSGLIGTAAAILLIPILIGAVFAAVHHAEEVAAYTGEPYGTLVLTIAVTVIELSLIVSVMLTGEGNPELARDTVYAVVMIVCNGLVGACILFGGLRYREQSFDVTGASIYLAVLIVLATLTLILPNFTRALPGPVYSASQLVFVSIVTIALYAVFLYTQTILHTNYFVSKSASPDEEHRPTQRGAFWGGILLIVAVVAVVLLAKKFAAIVDHGLVAVGAPHAVIGVLIALLVLMPEGMAAVQSARRDQLQKSLNLALGSSLATIGLTIPAVAVVNAVLQKDLVLGLEAKETVLLMMTFAASILTFSTGRTNILYGFLHLVIFGTFLFLTVVP
jgi:Ca2+:H+ antiporter